MRRVMHGALVLAGLVGCSAAPPPASVDEGRGKEALTKALEAWKKGDSAESFKAAQASIAVTDHDWADGLKLTDYKVKSCKLLFETSLRCEVELTLDDKGKAVTRKAVYQIVTGPVTQVARNDDDM